MDCFSVLIIIFIVAVVIRNAKANARPENRPGQPGGTPTQSQSRPTTQSIFTQTTQRPNHPIPNRPKSPVQTTINEQLKRMATETQQRTVTRPADEVAAEYQKRQEENRRKEELRKKLASAPQRNAYPNSQAQMTMTQQLAKDYAKAESENILDRANANVSEDFVSDEAEHARAAAPMSAQQLFESKETVDLSMAVLEAPGKSELMQEIDDLIVKGYDGSLHFDHDFVSEGIEKLNEMDGMTRIQEA